MAGYLIGFDVGSSSVKASLLDVDSGKTIASATSPETEMAIVAPQAGWAEQAPGDWWAHAKNAVAMIARDASKELAAVRAIGISYQMHGLVMLDRNGEVIRPSIIWCDSRAVPYGDAAFKALGEERCLRDLLNSPGNFTAAKLAWVKDRERGNFDKIWKIMLPGDYLAFRLTGEATTTASGLSEGILWNARENRVADFLLDHFGFSQSILSDVRPTFSDQGRVSDKAAAEIGLPAGIPVAYRAGDQPNNAFSLNVLEPGEMAATAGTSGVVYGIVDRPAYDPASRVNTFVHVNHRERDPRFGVLLCLNGTGILNRWLKQNAVDGAAGGQSVSYDRINAIAAEAPIGSDGVMVLPFGNGAERTLENRDPGASVHGLNFNIHDRRHLLRAGQEGIVFALRYGLEIMRAMNMRIETVKAGHANMFLSPLFASAFATVCDTTVHLYKTDGSEGAARGAGFGAGIFGSMREAFEGLAEIRTIEPDRKTRDAYEAAYGRWRDLLAYEVLDRESAETA